MGIFTGNEIGVHWTPILHGVMRSDAIASIQAVSSALQTAEFARPNHASLASGAAGVALFYTFLSEAQPDLDESSADLAFEFISRSVQALTSEHQTPRFYGGFTGIAWALEHLQGRLLERDDDDPNASIDEALTVLVEQNHWRGDYELISGLVGYGVYALERRFSSRRIALLTAIVRHLEETAIATSDGLTWFTPPYLLPERQREHTPDGYFNLGVAHGVPGVIALLAQICSQGIALGSAQPLLNRAVSWLLSQEVTAPGAEGFPSTLWPDGRSTARGPARVAWCYGDLGIATALLWAARSVQESNWEREAIRIATRAAELPLEKSGVVDAGLCHGAAGNGHLFNRLYQATRNEMFLDAARRYFQRAIDFRLPGQGVGGFLSFSGYADEWKAKAGLLEGAAGVGLAFLAAVSSVEPEWDRMLLVSVPPR